ncbi:Dor1-like family-domain-containing protein [Rhodocollybia butyracea]|uniref:Conserved oligomeric Golgi complex subunit 8 n=1 Tax=Rhodocollybia butyracea TaxID=206335 RepID=A0A9P5U782_9AGAR|nr:Dor1-like family-domain-containing protein [Rhodocollybia butyracea]
MSELSELLNVSDTTYLEHLTSLGLETLLSEPSVLQTQSHHLTSSLTSLTHTSYPTFVSLYASTSALTSSLSQLSSSLDSLVNESLPALESSVSSWNTETASVLNTRRKTVTVLEIHDKLRDLLDIPLLMNTCVRNSYFSEALSLAAHAQALIAVYPSPPLILTSMLAEVNAAMNHMLVSLLTTLHEPNRKLPALWKAVNFLRKMESAFGGEEEIGLAFLSGRELCLKGSLESLRRDIFRITAVDGDLSSRDKEDLARYLGKYIGLWREGVYDLITQYDSIFLTNAVENDASSAKLHALLTAYISHVFKTHLIPLLAASQHSSKPPIASLPMSSFPSLVTQLTYCAAALARVGAEFRSTIARCVNDAVTHIFSSDISLVEKRFLSQFERATKKGKDVPSSPTVERKAIPRSPSKWLLKADAEQAPHLPTSPSSSISSTIPSHTPPSLLTSYPPLATHANEVIEVLNAFRACAPISVAQGYQCDVEFSTSSTNGASLFKILERSLANEGRTISDYVKSVIETEESSDGTSMKLLRESTVAVAFARAFFETWAPWAMKATTSVYGVEDTLQLEASELVQIQKDLESWVKNVAKE